MGHELASGWIDYWCNAFAPAMQERWDRAIAEQDIPLKIRSDENDSFVDPAGMIARMDKLEMKSLVLPCADVPDHAGATGRIARNDRFGLALLALPVDNQRI